ncbi:hypothetical protein BYT27DRAFT_7256470 [Phlegmacium glaucopus]|nr:hypothetical protein BYT27DRAFT_7256470 [Phlegmacium glaucopus]
MSAFPTEIFDAILSYSSYSTLLTTSSVNSTFHLITRKYLFSSISLKRTVYNRDTASRARTFLSLLKRIPDLANCVRRIHIDFFGKNLYDSSNDLVPDAKPLITVLSRLPRLNIISLRGRDSTISPPSWLDWEEVCVELRQAFARTFRSPLVSEIKISHIHNFSLSIFVGCHSLKHLSLNVVSSRKSLPSQSDIGSRPRLKSLVLRHSFTVTNKHNKANLEWLFSPQGIFDISQLGKFVFSGGVSHIEPARILSLCAGSIESFELKMDTTVKGTYSIVPFTPKSTPLPPSPIDLDILSNLTKLVIVATLTTIETYRSRHFSYSSPLPWIVARLDALTPASDLSEIILQLNLSIMDTNFEAIDWGDLTRILSSKNLPNLNLVTLKVSGRHNPLSPVQWAVLKNNRHLSPLVEDGRLVLVNSNPL